MYNLNLTATPSTTNEGFTTPMLTTPTERKTTTERKNTYTRSIKTSTIIVTENPDDIPLG